MSLLKLINSVVFFLVLVHICHSNYVAIRGQLLGSNFSPSTLFPRQALSCVCCCAEHELAHERLADSTVCVSHLMAGV